VKTIDASSEFGFLEAADDHEVYFAGLVRYADAHWGYGFPIGGVAGFDPGGSCPAAGWHYSVVSKPLLRRSQNAMAMKRRASKFSSELLKRCWPQGIVDLIEAVIIDPTKVVHIALENAVSVAVSSY
jgi:hypothetical protein